MPVTHKRIGVYCNHFSFESKLKDVTINYELIMVQGNWKVNGPDFDYPDMSLNVLLKSLRTSAENKHGTNERRVKFKDTARSIEKGVSHKDE